MHKHLRVVALGGSLSETSSTAAIVSQMLLDLPPDLETTFIALNRIAPEALLGVNHEHPSLQTALEAVGLADGVILGTPIYKASLSGLLKAFIDHLPQYGLAGKAVLPIGTGGSLAHALALDYGMRPILQSMGARHVVQSVFFSPADIPATGARDLRQQMATNARYVEALLHFTVALQAVQPVPLLGHPVPARLAPSFRKHA